MKTKHQEIIKEQIQNIYGDAIEKHGLNMGGETIYSDIHEIRTEKPIHKLIFEDEYMMDILAGNIPSSIYDEIEKEINALGFVITDTDGTILHLEDHNWTPITQG